MPEQPDSFFRDICHSTGVALIATDEQFHVLFWNEAATRLFGQVQPITAGQLVSDLVPADRREIATRLLERALRGEVNELEFLHPGPQGQTRYLAVTLSGIKGPDGQMSGVSVFARDVTRRIMLSRQFAAAQKMSALGAMAGAIAHHFNNLIGGIITSVDFAQRSDNPDMLRRALATTTNSLNRASRLVRGLLAFAEGDRTESAARELPDILKEYIESIRPRLEEKSIRLETNIPPLHVSYPSKRILTILENLVTNSVDAMPEGGTLSLELRPLGLSEVELRVRDTGNGLCEENLPHVFEPFFTTKGADGSTVGEHAGLGLAVVHGVVKDLGGSVDLVCNRPSGATCTIRLPVPLDEE
jgi:two-component system, cell cycle sensor histidine kinase and response regulator CckA